MKDADSAIFPPKVASTSHACHSHFSGAHFEVVLP